MAKLVVLITRQLEQVDDVAAVWEKNGVEGATILDAFGVRSYQERVSAIEFLPGMRSALNMLRENQEHSILLFSVVYEESQIEPIIQATEGVLGKLAAPDTGLLFVMDVEWVTRKVISSEQ